jgi:glycosyltransferase involved in cell wall biosynthesis
LSDAGIRTRQRVVPLGVSSMFVPVKSKALAKSKVGISESLFVVGFCGRIAREKDLPTLYRAFERFHKLHPNSVLLIVGEGLRVPRSKYIVHAGRQDDVVPFLQAMDVFVLPSLTETSSLATMEAMCVGLPVVVTPVGGIRDYVVDGRNGLIFNCGDANALFIRLELLFNHPNLRSRLGVAGRKSIVKSHSWKDTVKKVSSALHF